MISFYPAWVRSFAEEQVNRSKDDAALVSLLGLLGIEVVLKTEFVENWFAEGSSLSIPLSLVEAVERESQSLHLGDRRAVLAIGPAYNFYTLQHDLGDYLFGNQAIPRARPDGLPADQFAMVQVPRLEGGGGLWWPLVLGHELSHLAVIQDSTIPKLNLAKRIDWKVFAVLPKDQAKFLDMAESWATELVCDAYCVRRFGPAGAASLVEVLDHLGGAERVSETHPPGWLRFRLVRKWVGEVKDPQLGAILAHCEEVCAMPMPNFAPDVGRLLVLLESLQDELFAVVNAWGGEQFVAVDRQLALQAAIEDLAHGIPPKAGPVGSQGKQLQEEDVINAGWIEWTQGSRWPIGKLIGKSLDDLAFVRHWMQVGGKIGIGAGGESAVVPAGVLSGGAISERLGRGWDQDGQLIVTPLLPHALGTGSFDVRLGPKFIVFHRTDTASIKTFDPTWDPSEVQRLVEVGWGDSFVLHPNELVLASTLEYMALPADLSAQVITRSSYGRMGLITATAVQVHPHFHGCLTLELLNLGLVPLELTPGERIAQLVFIAVQPPAPKPESEDRECPVGPEFSRPLKQSAEASLLFEIVKKARARRSTTAP
jgi:deoxycytidine triphosphate deaminase